MDPFLTFLHEDKPLSNNFYQTNQIPLSYHSFPDKVLPFLH